MLISMDVFHKMSIEVITSKCGALQDSKLGAFDDCGYAGAVSSCEIIAK